MAAISTAAAGAPATTPRFGFLTNHGNALLLIAQDSRIRIRDLAGLLGITERATQKIVADLDRAGYISRERDGRRNRYTVRTHLPVGLPTQRDIDIRTLLGILNADRDPANKAGRPRAAVRRSVRARPEGLDHGVGSTSRSSGRAPLDVDAAQARER